MLKTITFTGIDRFTDIHALIALQNDYPVVEFAVLAIPETNKIQYLDPDLLRHYEGTGLNLSLHLCSELNNAVMESGDWSEVRTYVQEHLHVFTRIQLNIARYYTAPYEWRLTVPEEVKEVIIQQTSIDNMPVYHAFLDEEAKGNRPGNFTMLLDASGGRGIYNAELRACKRPYVGYAGGLRVENVKQFVCALESNDEVTDYWIDMQQSLRDSQDRFSVDLCRKVCECLA